MSELVKKKKQPVDPANALKTMGEAWQDARIRTLAAEAFDTVMQTRCTLDTESYRLDINDMFKRHNDTTTRLAYIEDRLAVVEKRLFLLQDILNRVRSAYGLVWRVAA